jgi:D-arabinose 1-dehydrogenase-like Zn-dependent alcohol dehydrogenase
MRAVVYDEYGATPVVTDVPEPVCPDDGVLVRVGATGVCRSDWHAWIGHDPVPLPMVPGHEYAGTIAVVGSAVTRWQVGDRVTVPFACGCGRCAQCATGDTHVCPYQTQPGFTGWGSFAELVAVHAADTNVVALPDALGFLEAAALGCRFATAYRAVVASARIEAGEWLAVHGCGGVGLSAVMIGVARGAHVVAVDVAAPALAAAGELGATTIDATGLDARAVAGEVHRMTGLGAHASVDALGSVATMQSSVLGLRPRGRHVQVGLMLADSAVPPVPMGRVVSLELEIIGAHGMPARDYDEMLALVVSGVLPVERLVGRTIPLEDAPAALMAMSSPASASGITVVDLGDVG